MSVIKLCVGQPGAGKTYSRVRWLVDDFLVSGEGVFVTNLPIDVDSIASFMSDRTGKPVEYYLSRLYVIPSAILTEWEKMQFLDRKTLADYKGSGHFPPSDFFLPASCPVGDLSGGYICLDEFQLFFSKQHPPLLRQLWSDWFSEIRKLGCNFEAITQDANLFPREFIGKVGVTIDLFPKGKFKRLFFENFLL